MVWGKPPHIGIGPRIITGESHHPTKGAGKKEVAEMFGLGTVEPKTKNWTGTNLFLKVAWVSSPETVVNVRNGCLVIPTGPPSPALDFRSVRRLLDCQVPRRQKQVTS